MVRKAWMGVCVAVLVFAVSGCTFIEEINKLTILDVDLSQVADGVYEGAQENFPVTAKVKVTVSQGKIADIAILEHGHGPDHGAEAIIPRVLEKQSLIVDAVSGSTYSSRVILKAVEKALTGVK
jgi:uncharacterized protein with FMN-binding domain